MDYLEGNTELPMEALLMLLRSCQNQSLIKIELNITTLDNTGCYNNDNDDNDDDNSLNSLAVALLHKLTATAYSHIRFKLVYELKFNKDIIPSHYLLIKHRPKIDPITNGLMNTNTTSTTSISTSTSATFEMTAILDIVTIRIDNMTASMMEVMNL